MQTGDLPPSLRWIRDFAAKWHEPDFITRELRSLLTNDFRRVDHRKLIGVPGEIGPEEYVEQQKSFFDVGAGHPTIELLGVLDTRGERCVAMRSRIVYPDGAATEMITVRTFDAAVKKCARLVIFDPDDVTSALDELERQASTVSH